MHPTNDYTGCEGAAKEFTAREHTVLPWTPGLRIVLSGNIDSILFQIEKDD